MKCLKLLRLNVTYFKNSKCVKYVILLLVSYIFSFYFLTKIKKYVTNIKNLHTFSKTIIKTNTNSLEQIYLYVTSTV